MRKHLSSAIALILGLAAVPAAAAPITTVFTFDASGFTDLLGSATPPVDPVNLRISLTFDPASGDQFDNPAGLALLGSSVAIAGPLAFDYDSAGDVLTFGGAGLSTAITAGTDDALAQVTTAYRGTPGFGGLEYTTANSPGIFLSTTGTVTASRVPEPGTIVLMLSGLAALGVTRRRS